MSVDIQTVRSEPPLADPLAPVRAALLARARRQAEVVLADADEDVATQLAEARRRADAVLAEAAAHGAADAEAVLRSELTRARREARGILLRARQEARELLRAEVRSRVTALRDDPRYSDIRTRLAARARAALGPDAVVEDDPAGGIVARAGSRRASYSLTALADQVLEAMGPELEGLWQVAGRDEGPP